MVTNKLFIFVNVQIQFLLQTFAHLVSSKWDTDENNSNRLGEFLKL